MIFFILIILNIVNSSCPEGTYPSSSGECFDVTKISIENEGTEYKVVVENLLETTLMIDLGQNDCGKEHNSENGYWIPFEIPSPFGGCDDYEDAIQYGGKCYFTPRESNGKLYHRTWTAAKQICQDRGGYLASIHSFEENQFVKSYIIQYVKSAYNSAYYVWIGATDEHIEGNWVWSDDSDWDYTNWAPREPSNSGNVGEDYAVYSYYHNGKWGDFSKWHKLYFFCTGHSSQGTAYTQQITQQRAEECFYPQELEEYTEYPFMLIAETQYPDGHYEEEGLHGTFKFDADGNALDMTYNQFLVDGICADEGEDQNGISPVDCIIRQSDIKNNGLLIKVSIIDDGDLDELRTLEFNKVQAKDDHGIIPMQNTEIVDSGNLWFYLRVSLDIDPELLERLYDNEYVDLIVYSKLKKKRVKGNNRDESEEQRRKPPQKDLDISTHISFSIEKANEGESEEVITTVDNFGIIFFPSLLASLIGCIFVLIL